MSLQVYKEYEKHTSLIRYFSKPKFKEYHSKLFGTMKYFKQFSAEEYEKLSIVHSDNSDVQDSCQYESSEYKNVDKETNSIQKNDNEVSSSTDKLPQNYSNNNSDHPYWTKGKWREYL